MAGGNWALLDWFGAVNLALSKHIVVNEFKYNHDGTGHLSWNSQSISFDSRANSWYIIYTINNRAKDHIYYFYRSILSHTWHCVIFAGCVWPLLALNFTEASKHSVFIFEPTLNCIFFVLRYIFRQQRERESCTFCRPEVSVRDRRQ